MPWGEDLYLGSMESFAIPPIRRDICRLGVNLGRLLVWIIKRLEELMDAFEVAIDDIEMVDFGTTQHQGKSNVPVGLFA